MNQVLIRERSLREDAAQEGAPSPRARMLAGFVADLDRLRVPYCVLRGHASFPHLHPGGDVDIAVDPSRIEDAVSAIEEGARREGVAIWERHRSGSLSQFLLYARPGPGRHEFFGIDLHTAETFFGIPFLPASEILARANRSASLPRPEPAQSACIDALVPFLASGTIPEKHAVRFRAAVREDPDGIREELARWFGERTAKRILGAPELPLAAMRFAVTRRTLWRRPVAAARGFWNCLVAERLRPWFRPRGRMIAMLGTDGTGKSTLLQAVLQELERSFPRTQHHVFHFRPGWLPPLDALRHGGRASYSLADMSRPHRARPSGRLGSTLRAAYYACDFVVGYRVRVLPLRRRPALIAFDRYVHDYLVDPLRSRIRRDAPFVRLLCRLSPSPDRIFVCTAGLDLVRSRKQELSEEETRTQIEGYEAFARAHPRAVLVRTDGGIQDAVDLILDVVFGEAAP